MISHATTVAAPAVPARLSWRRVVGTAAGIALGIVLLVAAWAKALDPQAFAEEIWVQGIAPVAAAPIAARWSGSSLASKLRRRSASAFSST